MDFNFLVFPKPEFDPINRDLFYSRLLFVPKVNRNVKTITLKKPALDSRRKTEWNNKSHSTNIKDRNSLSKSKCFGPKWDFTETSPRRLDDSVIKNPSIFLSKSKHNESAPVFSPLKKTKQPNEPETLHDEMNEKRPAAKILIPMMHKSVRFPTSQKTKSPKSSEKRGSLVSKILIQNPKRMKKEIDKEELKSKLVPYHTLIRGPGAQKNKGSNIKLALNPSSSSLTSSLNASPVKVSLSKLMNNLDGNDSLKVRELPTTIKTKSFLDSKYINRSSIINSPSVKKNINSSGGKPGDVSLCESFTAPQEHPEINLHPLSKYESKVLKSLKYQKNSQELTRKPFQSIPSEKETDFLTCSANFNINASEGDLRNTYAAKLKSIQAKKNPFMARRGDVNNILEMEEFDSVHSKIGLYSSTTPQGDFSIGMSKLNAKNFSQEKPQVLKSPVRPALKKKATRAINHLENTVHEHLSIPCIVLKPPIPSSKVIMYFHANGEDIALIQEFCALLANSFKVDFFSAVLGGCSRVP